MRTARTPLAIALAALALAAPARAASTDKTAADREAATLRRGDAYYHFLRARMEASRGRFSDTLRELKLADALLPDSAELLAESAHLLAQINRRDEAERLARRAIEIDPKSPAALRILADLSAARALGRPPDEAARKEAIGLYERLAATADADVAVLQILTNLKLLSDDLPGALASAERFAKLRPADGGAAKLLAQILVQQGKPDEALQAVLTFLAANPASAELSRLASDIAERIGGWAEVEAAARRISESTPGEIAPKVLLGEALLRQGRSADAVTELTRALETAGTSPAWEGELRALLGEAYMREGRHEDAVPLLERAVAVGTTEPMVRLQLATAYGTVGRLADASKLAGELAETYPGNLSILVILGECMAQQGSVAASVEAFESAIAGIDGSDSGDVERRDDVRLRIAALHVAHRKGSDAEAALKGLELPDRPEALEVRARVALLAGRPREARELAEKLPTRARGAATLLTGEALAREGRAVKAEASFTEAIAMLGDPARERVAAIWRDLSQPQRAERLLRDWVRVAPDDAEARFALGRQLERHGSFVEAEGELRRTIELDPSNAQALNYLGYSLADRSEKLDDALRYVKRALELDAWNGAYHDSLGWVYFRMGRLEQAREPLERAAREFPFDATVLEHLGDLYDKLGEKESAERAWRRALAAEPENPATIRAKLERAKAQDPGRI